MYSIAIGCSSPLAPVRDQIAGSSEEGLVGLARLGQAPEERRDLRERVPAQIPPGNLQVRALLAGVAGTGL